MIIEGPRARNPGVACSAEPSGSWIMNARRWFAHTLMILMIAVASRASARALSIEVWTARGHAAVYQDGEVLQIKARASDDSYLLVYEIDSACSVHLLFPDDCRSSCVEGARPYRLPV